MLSPEEKRNWFEANDLLRTEQERTIADLRVQVKALEDAILGMNPISPAVFVGFEVREVRDRIIKDRKEQEAIVNEQ